MVEEAGDGLHLLVEGVSVEEQRVLRVVHRVKFFGNLGESVRHGVKLRASACINLSKSTDKDVRGLGGCVRRARTGNQPVAREGGLARLASGGVPVPVLRCAKEMVCRFRAELYR